MKNYSIFLCIINFFFLGIISMMFGGDIVVHHFDLWQWKFVQWHHQEYCTDCWTSICQCNSKCNQVISLIQWTFSIFLIHWHRIHSTGIDSVELGALSIWQIKWKYIFFHSTPLMYILYFFGICRNCIHKICSISIQHSQHFKSTLWMDIGHLQMLRCVCIT